MNNGEFINNELNWLTRLIIGRIQHYFNQESSEEPFSLEDAPPVHTDECSFEKFISQNHLTLEDRVFLALSIVPVLKPQIMDCFHIKNVSTDRRFVEFGCLDDEQTSLIRPSLETVLFVLCGNDVEKKLVLFRHFLEHPLFSGPLFIRDRVKSGINFAVAPSPEFIDKIILEKDHHPEQYGTFPAKRITTLRSWDELVLDKDTIDQIDDLRLWLKYGEDLLDKWKLRGKIRNGHRALFYGPPGTGKTFTATLLGKECGREVYCIDLSMVVSKYIGETEKNLANLFAKAEGQDWILFFDEADALFGKRTGVKDAHDRYANQEVAYLLQRIEDYRGLVILSTNLKTNLDDAFARRFQTVVHFRMPNPEAREKLWRQSFSECSRFADDIDLKEISARHEISGGSILNVVQYCSLRSMSRNTDIISREDLIEGIRKEFRKEGKVL